MAERRQGTASLNARDDRRASHAVGVAHSERTASPRSAADDASPSRHEQLRAILTTLLLHEGAEGAALSGRDLRTVLEELLRRADSRVEQNDPTAGTSGEVLVCELRLARYEYRLLRRETAGHHPNGYRLSKRESEILALIGRGYANPRIAESLAISAWTVSTHIRRIFAKLGATSRAHAIAIAGQAGLLTRHGSDESVDLPLSTSE